jgi:hypothetical protein
VRALPDVQGAVVLESLFEQGSHGKHSPPLLSVAYPTPTPSDSQTNWCPSPSDSAEFDLELERTIEPKREHPTHADRANFRQGERVSRGLVFVLCGLFLAVGLAVGVPVGILIVQFVHPVSTGPTANAPANKVNARAVDTPRAFKEPPPSSPRLTVRYQGRTAAQSVLMSVWRTCWQQGRSAIDCLSLLLRGRQSQGCANPGLNVWSAGAAVALKSRDRQRC